MNLTELFKLREKLINEAIQFSMTLPESERNLYVNTYIDAAMNFYAKAVLTIIENESDVKKAA